ncbi:MAG: hypothetical protein ACHQNA_14500, partial [Acidimicrobiales bacterium]
RYSPSADGSGYTTSTDYLAAPTDLSGVRAMRIVDGTIFTLASDGVTRYFSGQASSFALKVPPDQVDVRPGHDYRLVDSSGEPPSDRLWLWDASHDRIVAFSRSDGSYVGQYIVQAGDVGYVDLTGMAVVQAGANQPPVLIWVTGGSLMASPLQAVSGPGVSPSPSAVAPSASPRVTPRPKGTPKPTARH